MAKRVGFYRSWLSLRTGDLGKLDLEAFTAALSTRAKLNYTLGLVLVAVLVLVVAEPLAAVVVFAAGLWVVWNRNNRITKLEKRVFITLLDVALFLGLAEKFHFLFGATGLLLIAVLLHLAYVWRR